MTRDEIVAAIGKNADAIKGKGVSKLALLGSRAGEDYGANSEIDILIEIEPDTSFSLLNLIDVEHIIEDATGLQAQATVRRSRCPPASCRTVQMTLSKYSDAHLGALSLKFMTRLSVALALSATCVFSALAADPKPDAAIKTKSIEARLFLDDKIKADAPLAADCLAEGRKWLDKNAAEAAAARKADPQFFKDAGWDFERKYTIRSIVADRYVSLLRNDYMNTNGAHPNSDVNTILWDKADNKRISIRPFFTETADNGATMKAMVKAIITSLKAEKKKRDAGETATDEWFKELKPSLLKVGAVTLAPSTEAGKSAGLTFHYSPYAVGPYAEGEYVAFVPWETLKPYLTAEGTRIFGGARPKGDAEEP